MERDTYTRMAQIQSAHWWYKGRRRILHSQIEKLSLPSNAKILEAGSGPGANLLMLKNFGAVSAFEPDDFACAHAQQTSGLEVKKGGLPRDIPFAGPFDLICAFDVIEHMKEDLAGLKALHAINGKGYAVFTVPAFPFLWSQHDEANHHYRRYVRPRFRALLEEAGYEVEFISYYNMFLFPPVAIIRLLKNMLGVKDSPDEKMPRCNFLNSLLTFIFESEKYLLNRLSLPFGVSLIAVCRAT